MMRKAAIRSLRIFILITLGLMGVVTVFQSLIQSGSLLARATHHANIDGKLTTATYWWLSSRDIVAVSSTYDLDTIDVETGNTTRLPPILADFHRFQIPVSTALTGGSSELGEASYVFPSPDGRWIVRAAVNSNHGYANGTVAASIDGRAVRKWKYESVPLSKVIWSADSHHFLIGPDMYDGPPKGEGGLLCSVDKSEEWTHVPYDMMRITDEGTILRDGTVLIFGDQFYTFTPPTEKVTIIETSARYSYDSVKYNSVRLPVRSNVLFASFSPAGDRIAWELERSVLDNYPQFLRSVLSRIGFVKGKTSELWVSDTAGGKWRFIGETLSGKRAKCNHFRWNPDGSRLSFLFDRSLYSIPVNI